MAKKWKRRLKQGFLNELAELSVQSGILICRTSLKRIYSIAAICSMRTTLSRHFKMRLLPIAKNERTRSL